MAASGAKSVEGGNFQIFEEFAVRSGADIRLNTEVKDIKTLLEYNEDEEVVTRYILETSDGNMDSFDVVIIAAPLVRCMRFPMPTCVHPPTFSPPSLS
jgi:prenylcysteine oxidase/farnesylcysteine lyase